jgi:hypothetical protein
MMWVSLDAQFRCRFFDDVECEVEHENGGGGMMQGPQEKTMGIEGAKEYKCGWGY